MFKLFKKGGILPKTEYKIVRDNGYQLAISKTWMNKTNTVKYPVKEIVEHDVDIRNLWHF